MYHYIANISGRGSFPIDMLRYDACHPVSSEDAGIIAASQVVGGIRENGHRVEWTVQVMRKSRTKLYPAFTVARWESFCCTCTEVDHWKEVG